MDSNQLVTILKALADPTRLKIVGLLSHRNCCICELVPIFGISQPAVSKHMSRLKSAGLVVETRRGQWVFYALNHERLEQVRFALGNLPDYSAEFERLAEQGLLVTCE
ncbi:MULTISPECIES: metalloregulator ArsR/SmtB family transcription factor [Brevibacillus]|uniref:ArsR family transcriptional regulator n=1 Tax=Brevibacillus invocatus TaxID=173959 RepID=A0A3M8CCD5_9BACL|nr:MULTISPECIES: metalloregulator ArsR/SmtB family transcription factor [Brevibacillus]MCM3080186.1 metalloregulator ArsR/SmtB family transcription factor [Brevibacillus invocatus]MCM3430368.1 metalloregulator ArsR/SmtB family transcription factor [Brevibacillus invocatus]MDH4619170.1 winged helix-turn-helix transcriptional regulator [Brevibacillus sp. AY1]RNB73161.1 ArsR family transcriptional regulator [Brevibacillus invocatus]